MAIPTSRQMRTATHLHTSHAAPVHRKKVLEIWAKKARNAADKQMGGGGLKRGGGGGQKGGGAPLPRNQLRRP